MPFTLEQLRQSPNPLVAHYLKFRVADRVLLTGHSHQAWPDVAQAGQQAAFEDAAALVDGKWERALGKAERVRQGFRELLDDPAGLYSLSNNTHNLLVRFLSALPLRQRPRLVTTDVEFHSLRRQLARLREESIEVVQVAALPAATVAERLAEQVDDKTAAVLTSTVFFLNAHIAGDLSVTANACRKHGAKLLLDVYHQLGVVPCSLRKAGLEDVFVVGGGYKYLQLGEGNCFLRFPADCKMRPVVTGWFAEFDALSDEPGQSVFYSDGNQRFAGATYDPCSHYRATAVFDFFAAQQLNAELLRAISQHQIGRLHQRIAQLDLDPMLICSDIGVPRRQLAGFLALSTPHAARFHRGLGKQGVLTDYRGKSLRLGPAPYLSDQQLDFAVEKLAEVAKAIAAGIA